MARTEALRSAIPLEKGQAVLLTNPSNMFYVSGYTGEGKVLITMGKSVIITDFRYTEQAQREAPEYTVCMTEKGLSHDQIVTKLLKEEAVDTLLIEDDAQTVREFQHLKDELGDRVHCMPLGNVLPKLRQIKDAGEIALIREACRITSVAFERALTFIKAGVTERDVALFLEQEMYKEGADKPSFDTIVAAGENGSLPHAKPGARVIANGDMVTMDFGAKYKGYCADMTRTVCVGKPSDVMLSVYKTVLQAQQEAQSALMAGKSCREIDKIARDLIDNHGYEGRFGHGLGHSLGIDIHEEPRLSYSSGDETMAGQLLTVEPGVYLPGVGGVRIENTCLVLDGGCEALTTPTRELICL